MVAIPTNYYYATPGYDNYFGATDAQDVVVFDSESEANTGDVFRGGASASFEDTIEIRGPLQIGFAGVTFGSFERLDFTSPPPAAAQAETTSPAEAPAGPTATFLSSHFATGRISQSLRLNSYNGYANVVVEAAQNFSAAAWQFGSWDENTDLVTLVGNALDNTLTDAIVRTALVGGDGDDRYYIGNFNSYVVENNGEGTDTVYANADYTLGANVENLVLITSFFGAGNELGNRITGNANTNTLYGYDGNDTIYGGAGNDGIDGGSGNDTLFGEADDDIVDGLAGEDRLYGGDGNDWIYGGDDNDRIYGDSGDDTLVGDAGDDRIYGGEGNDLIEGGAGNDLLYSNGDKGFDTLRGGSGNDRYYIDGGGTDDVQETGGEGIDTVYTYGDFTLNALVDVEYVRAIDGAGNLHLTGNEIANRLYGNDGDNWLFGEGSADSIYGNAGNDTLFGGEGIDNLYGGANADVFVLSPAQADRDYLRDFVHGTDYLYVDTSFFPAYDVGKTMAEQFVSNVSGQAESASDRFIYENDRGLLYFDADGSGTSSARVLVAYVVGAPVVNADDFVVGTFTPVVV